MSPHLVTVDGHLVHTPDGHLGNFCDSGYSDICTTCLETQPSMSWTYNDGACVVEGDGVLPFWRYYDGGGGTPTQCFWEWRDFDLADDNWTIRLIEDTVANTWLGFMLYWASGTNQFGDGAGGGKDLTSDIDCDENGIIDHLVAAPFTLESQPATCGVGGIISVTLNV